MYRILIATIALAVIGVDCTLLTISGPGWKNEIQACLSEGEHHGLYTFDLGRLSDYNIGFESISSVTSVVAEGDLQMRTKKKGWVPKTQLQLSQASVAPDCKIFKGDWKIESSILWATHIVEMAITVKFYSNDKIYMETYVSAGSWRSLYCAEVKAYVNRIQVYL